MANRIVSVHVETCGMGIYVIMLPSSGFSVAHWPHYYLLPAVFPGDICTHTQKHNNLSLCTTHTSTFYRARKVVTSVTVYIKDLIIHMT